MIEFKVLRFGDALGVILLDEAVARLKAQDGASLYLSEAADGA